jgi:ribose transport system ATP-binding protein
MALVELRGVTKRFGATLALERVSLSLEAGQVHALVGENGSGKSTLMRVLAGVFRPDDGEMSLDGTPFRPQDPGHARSSGVAMIHQELSLCDHLSVVENILLGVERTNLGFLARSEQTEVARSALSRLGHEGMDLDASVGSLPISLRQTVEIARALALGCRVIVFDEPTSSLSHQDAEQLFVTIDALRAHGCAVVYISHFFDEVRRVADVFTVLRDGRNAGSGAIGSATDSQIVAMMVGRNLDELYPRSQRTPGEVALELSELAGRVKPSEASLQVRAGEVVGIAGLAGAGRTELLRVVFGLDSIARGRVRLKVFVGPYSPARRWAQGAGMLSEDRKSEGLALGMTVAENALLTTMPVWVSRKWEESHASAAIERLAIKTQGAHQAVGDLSGGNQQKVALARLLAHDADVYLLDEPTRGIDVASKEQIYRLIDQAASRGKAVLMVSSYLPELLGVCDHIAVMARGRLGNARPVGDWTQESLMEVAVGA